MADMLELLDVIVDDDQNSCGAPTGFGS